MQNKKHNLSITLLDKDFKVKSNVLETCSDLIQHRISTIENLIKNLSASAKSEDLNEMVEYLSKLLYITYDLGYSLNFNMDKMFREVHRSNMTKVCNNIKDAKESIEFYELDNRYKQPTIRIKGSYFVVFDSDTTKILKNHKWEQPDLKQFF